MTEVLKQYGGRLSDYEKQEIEKYPEVWFLGLESTKINAKPGTPLNSGYDDENGSYNKVSSNKKNMFIVSFMFFNYFRSFTIIYVIVMRFWR